MGPRGLHPSPRNVPDDLIKAIAGTGGVIGTAGFPGFLGTATKPLSVSTTTSANMRSPPPSGPGKNTTTPIRAGSWQAGTYPPPHHYPDGIATPRELPNLTARMLERGFTAEDVTKVLGTNWMRVYSAVWGAVPTLDDSTDISKQRTERV
jgi:membrane dipeptidase